MGRHEKIGTTKKEKIYALRRKLDDFIEEDKKRRDRNLYILERFEKMKSTVALLKNINNNILSENENSVNHINFTRNNDSLVVRQKTLNHRENRSDDSDMLKEISKNYILIPRVYSINRYPVIDIKHSEDVDWRSKYNILDEIKKRERLEPPERDTTEHFVQKETILRNNNSLRINDNNINSLTQDSERYNILPNKNIYSNYEGRDEPASVLLNSNRNTDSKIHGPLNVPTDCKPTKNGKHIEHDSNINSQCIREVDMSTEVCESNYADDKNSTKILKEHNISKIDYDANAHVTEKIQHMTESHSIIENSFDKPCEDINIGKPQLPPNILPELQINEADVDKYKTEQQESLYSENTYQNAKDSEEYQDLTPETYANDNNVENGKYHNNYEEPQLQQESHEPHGNVRHENQVIAGSHNQDYEEEHVDSQKSQFNNGDHSENYENYEAQNNYSTENQNHEYQNVDQQKSECNNYNNPISLEPTENAFENYNENEENYTMRENGIEFDQQQQIYDQQNYIDPSQGDIQQLYVDNNEEIPENSSSENLQDDPTNQEEIYTLQHEYNNGEILENSTSENLQNDPTNQEQTYTLQHEYNAQNHAETEQQFNVDHYSNVQNENDNIQHDFNNQNFNESYQDNNGAQDLAYDPAQGQEIQQHDELGYSEQSQGEFIHYNEDSGLNVQNDILQEDYVDQNIDGIYQEETLQGHDIQDNGQYDYTPQGNELEHTDINGQVLSQENYVES